MVHIKKTNKKKPSIKRLVQLVIPILQIRSLKPRGVKHLPQTTRHGNVGAGVAPGSVEEPSPKPPHCTRHPEGNASHQKFIFLVTMV